MYRIVQQLHVFKVRYSLYLTCWSDGQVFIGVFYTRAPNFISLDFTQYVAFLATPVPSIDHAWRGAVEKRKIKCSRWQTSNWWQYHCSHCLDCPASVPHTNLVEVWITQQLNSTTLRSTILVVINRLREICTNREHTLRRKSSRQMVRHVVL